jgi:nicotinamide riboside transporter PnuC
MILMIKKYFDLYLFFHLVACNVRLFILLACTYLAYIYPRPALSISVTSMDITYIMGSGNMI